MTHHIGGLPHTDALLLIPETTADLNHIPHTDLVDQHLLNLHPALTIQGQYIRIRNIEESPLMTPSLTTTVLMMHPVILMMIKLKESSLSNALHEVGGPPIEKTVTVAQIMYCPTITVHAAKCYKALID